MYISYNWIFRSVYTRARNYSAIIGNFWKVTIWILVLTLFLTNEHRPSFQKAQVHHIIQSAIIAHIHHKIFEYTSQDIEYAQQDSEHT